MSHILGFTFYYKKYIKDAKIRIWADDHLVDEFLLTEDIKEKVVEGQRPYTMLEKRILGETNLGKEKTVTYCTPEKLFLYEIADEFLSKEIRIDLENDNNNHTNGFMTKYSYVNFHSIFLAPKWLFSEKTFLQVAKRLYEGVDVELEKGRYWWPCFMPTENEKYADEDMDLIANLGVKSDAENELIDLELGGSFQLKLPLSRKHGVVCIKKNPVMGRVRLSTNIIILDHVFDIINNFK
jgi:hypothetical protein|tara:strand:- start:433 stop:1146 length:714 start_codon:yes stop_codon:yes gene_type:complete